MSLPPSEIPSGAMRFNSDSQKLEYWNGSAWFQVHTATPNLATAGDPTPGARGVFAGGNAAPGGSTASDTIDYINISSTGTAQDFGNLTTGKTGLNSGSCSSSTRGITFAGNTNPANVNEIRFITISSTGGDSNFGTLDTSKRQTSSVSNQTRGVVAGGTEPANTNLDYITIASTGNGVDFGGSLTVNRDGAAGLSSPTRGIFAGGGSPAVPTYNQASSDFITIATLGNAQDFGDLTQARHVIAGISNVTRGLCGGGLNPGVVNIIEYFTIASLGNAVNFGDLTIAKRSSNGCASPTRGIFAGGVDASDKRIEIDYVNILTEGNAVDFGDLTEARMEHTSFSNAHGGL